MENVFEQVLILKKFWVINWRNRENLKIERLEGAPSLFFLRS